ncbi:MAG: hypothetical protein AAF741_18045 [Bacteroidota bacterium]
MYQKTTTSSLGDSHFAFYYLSINDAERSILQGDTIGALESYKQAFTKVVYPFPSDLHNAALASVALSDQAFGKRCIMQMADYGVTPVWLENNRDKYYSNLFVKGEWSVFSEEYQMAFDRYQRVEAANEAQRVLARIDDRDQAIREEIIGNYWPVDSVNLIEFKSLIDRYGFPSLRELGLPNPFYQRLPYINFLNHSLKHLKREIHNYPLDSLLIHAVYNGRIEPYMAGKLLDIYTAKVANFGQYGTSGYFFLDNTEGGLCELVYNENEIQILNSKRAEIYLDDYEIFLAKWYMRHDRIENDLPDLFRIPKDYGSYIYPSPIQEVIEIRRVDSP